MKTYNIKFLQTMGKTLHLVMLLALILLGGSSLRAQTTVTQTSFTGTSGNVGGDKNVSYKAEKGKADTDPQINKGEIRVYQNGGLFTVSVADGYTLTNVTLGSAMATKVTYVTDKTKTASAPQSIVKNGKLSLDFTGGEKSVTYTCTGTDKNSRLYVNSLSVTYKSESTGKTKTTLSFGDNADKTFDLNATEGTTFTQTATLSPAVEGAAITYASDNENIAIVDEKSGEVLVDTKAAGKATITATYAGNDTYDNAQASYTIEVVDPNKPKWVKTELSALTSTDQFVIVDLNSKKAMSNDGGSTSLPAAVTVTLSDDNSELTSDIADNLKWNVTSTGGSYTFYPNGKTDSWLYTGTTANNKSLYVGTGEAKTFTEATSTKYKDYKGLKDGTNNRYVGVQGNVDWRSYSEVNSTISNTSMAYFKRVSAGAATTLTLDENATEATITAGKNVNVTLKRTFNDNAWNTLVLPFDLTADQIAAAFGADAKVAAYSGATQNADNSYTLKFTEASSITANTPVFIYGAQAKAEGYTFTGVEVKDATPTQTSDAFNFVGTYVKTTVPVGNFFINANNKFFKAGDDKTNIKGTRASFEPVGGATSAKALGFSISEGGETTAINSVAIEDAGSKASAIYNLAGQRVNKAYKGVVVKDGKKYIQK